MDIILLIFTVMQLDLVKKNPDLQKFCSVMTVREQAFFAYSWPLIIENYSLANTVMDEPPSARAGTVPTSNPTEFTLNLPKQTCSYTKDLTTSVTNLKSNSEITLKCYGNVDLTGSKDNNIIFAILLAELCQNKEEFKRENVDGIAIKFIVNGKFASLTIVYKTKLSDEEFNKKRQDEIPKDEPDSIINILEKFRQSALTTLGVASNLDGNSYNINWKQSMICKRRYDENTLTKINRIDDHIDNIRDTLVKSEFNFGKSNIITRGAATELDRISCKDYKLYKPNTMEALWVKNRDTLILASEVGIIETKGITENHGFLQNGISIHYDSVDFAKFANEFKTMPPMTFETQIVAQKFSFNRRIIQTKIFNYMLMKQWNIGIELVLNQGLMDNVKIPDYVNSLGIGYNNYKNGRRSTALVSCSLNSHVYNEFKKELPVINQLIRKDNANQIARKITQLLYQKSTEKSFDGFVHYSATIELTSQDQDPIKLAIQKIYEKTQMEKSKHEYSGYGLDCRQKIQSAGKLAWKSKFHFVLALKIKTDDDILIDPMADKTIDEFKLENLPINEEEIINDDNTNQETIIKPPIDQENDHRRSLSDIITGTLLIADEEAAKKGITRYIIPLEEDSTPDEEILQKHLLTSSPDMTELERHIWTALQGVLAQEKETAGIKDKEPDAEIRQKLESVHTSNELSMSSLFFVGEITDVENIGELTIQLEPIKLNSNFKLLCWTGKAAVAFDVYNRMVFIAIDLVDLMNTFADKFNQVRTAENTQVKPLQHSERVQEVAHNIVESIRTKENQADTPNVTYIVVDGVPDNGKDNVISDLWTKIKSRDDAMSTSFQKIFLSDANFGFGIEFLKTGEQLTAVLVLHENSE